MLFSLIHQCVKTGLDCTCCFHRVSRWWWSTLYTAKSSSGCFWCRQSAVFPSQPSTSSTGRGNTESSIRRRLWTQYVFIDLDNDRDWPPTVSLCGHLHIFAPQLNTVTVHNLLVVAGTVANYHRSCCHLSPKEQINTQEAFQTRLDSCCKITLLIAVYSVLAHQDK